MNNTETVAPIITAPSFDINFFKQKFESYDKRPLAGENFRIRVMSAVEMQKKHEA